MPIIFKLDESFNRIKIKRSELIKTLESGENCLILAAEIKIKNQGSGSEEISDAYYFEAINGITGVTPERTWGEFIAETGYAIGDYMYRSGEQVLLGNYSDEVTLLGTGGQIALGATGLDAIADVRDIYHGIENYEFSWAHNGQLTLDTLSLLPLVGAFKYADNVAILWNGGKKAKKAQKANKVQKITKNIVEIKIKDRKIKKVEDISGFSKHGLNRIINRGIEPESIKSTIENPIKVTKRTDPEGRISFRYEGEKAVLNFNKNNEFITGWNK